MKRYILLNPGPVNTHPAVREALATAPDLCHREPEYFAVQDNVRALLLEVFGLAPAAWSPVLITGSGTAALEAAIASGVPHGATLGVIDNGVYGDRIFKIADAHGIKTEVVKFPWGTMPDLALVKQRFQAAKVGVVAAVHHETTTGALNPIPAIGKLARELGAAFIVDAISSLAGETLDIEGCNIDLVCSTGNKCIGAYPGIAFVLCRRAHLAKMRDAKPRTLYFNLVNYHDEQEKHSTPFTPAVQIMFSLEAALKLLAGETVKKRVAHFEALATRLRKGFQKLGLENYIDPKVHSNTITSLKLPKGLTYEVLHDHMKARGFVIYAGQGDLKKVAFRIANMGELTEADIDGVLAALGEAVNTKR